MKKARVLLAGIIIFAVSLNGQSHQSGSIADYVEIPVRIFKGNFFINNLTLNDFELYEDGTQQDIESLYLIQDNQIVRREGTVIFIPKVSKDYYLLFEISKVNAKLKNVIRFFIQFMLSPGDSLTIISPENTYRMKSNALKVLSTDEIERQVIRILNRDSLIRRSEYRNVLTEIMKMTEFLEERKNIDPSQNVDSTYANTFFEGFNLERYSYFLETLAHLRKVDETKLLNLARDLKKVEGEKNVFFLYQRDSIPYMKPKLLDQYIQVSPEKPDLVHRITYLANFFQRDLSFNADRLKQTFADSSITLDFLFFTKPLRAFNGVYVLQKPEDILLAFNDITRATGGVINSSLDPKNSIQDAREALQKYYVLYYSPDEKRGDGKFKELKIKAKIEGKDYQVFHRAGYYDFK
jgi:hypothetical protein